MDVITAIFHNFRPQAALRALLRLQSAVSPRRPHRGARDRERRGYASARMVRSRRLLLGLCLGWQAAACGPSEPGATDKPARPEALTEAEVDEPDLRALLRLDERSFPLTVWAAYIIQNEYFDKQRLDPRVQLVSALTYLGLHTPEFFAAVAGDQVTITVGSARQEFSLAGLDDLAVAADRLEMILGFAQAELKLEPEATHKLEYAAINGLLAPLDPHTILLTPEEHSDLGVKTRGQFGGIGAEIREDDRRIRIVKVLPGSPAEKAGLQSGDLLLQIDKQSTVNLRDADAQQLLRGPIDTEVVVKVRAASRPCPSRSPARSSASRASPPSSSPDRSPTCASHLPGEHRRAGPRRAQEARPPRTPPCAASSSTCATTPAACSPRRSRSSTAWSPAASW
jgi:hypothetical protein